MGKIKIKKSGQSQQCRCCLKEIGLKELWTEYYNGEEREVYGEMVNDCFALPWEPLFGKTEHICDSCITRLRDAVSFKREILYSNQLLNQEAKNESKLSVKQEEESDLEMETEYLSIEFMDDEDKNLMEIKIEQESKSEMTVKEESSPSKRGKRYTEDDLKKCMEAVMSGKMSQTKASIVYHVPRKTISAAVASPLQERIKKPAKAPNSNRSKQDEKAKHQDNITTLCKYTNATPIRCERDSRYGCCFCAKLFQEPAKLKKHNIETHPSDINTLLDYKKLHDYVIKLDITGLKCKLCALEIDSLDEIMEHLKEHNKGIHMDINNQIFPFNFEDDELKCAICKTDFNTFRKLFLHMHTHYRNHICEICAAGFITKRSYDAHYETHKKGVFYCEFCQKMFDTLSRKRSHESGVHRNSQRSMCRLCGERFSNSSKKEKHISSVHNVRVREIKCKQCGKVLPSMEALRVHTKRDHLLERPFECGFCDERFFRRGDMKNHMVKHTGSREYQCDVCDKKFGRKTTLKEHMRIHMDDRRFKCVRSKHKDEDTTYLEY
ncbi:zinc finger protein 62 homolog isoform X8 [Maniola jurtina]|uniref:zinc finger protein 62 homolog isoform X8 n=1 Tax=Maniola jurtina TaxID=191418 RepID=UPI001E686AB8|nr:zinc finger protein 62 homolog isoform X8 [Maniola jurtina]